VAAGFERVRVRSIRDEVYPQLMEYLARRLDAAEVKRRVNGLHRRRWRRAVRSSSYRKHTLETFDYVIAVAEKPSARAAGDAIG